MTDTSRKADYAAVILAGGQALRLGGVDKPALPVGGVPMIGRVLEAVHDATATVVVGLTGLRVPPDVRVVREQPPGGGPVAALAAAFQESPFRKSPFQECSTTDLVAVLAGDLPMLTNEAIRTLIEATQADGAVFVDDDDREQWLCGVWRVVTIKKQLADKPDHGGASIRRLLTDLDFARVRSDSEMPPWFDCDTEDDIKRAEEWLAR